MATKTGAECVKCGAVVQPGQENCRTCTWPFKEPGWSKTTFRICNITIDTSCVNVKHRIEALNILERWAEEGHIQIQRADVFLKELKGKARIEKAKRIPGHPPLFHFGMPLGGEGVLAGPDIGDSLRHVLFPARQRLNKNEEMDIRHLQLHVRTGGDCFVTLNTKDFIEGGKAEQLSTQLGVWVFTPDQAVALLKGLYGFC